MKKESELIENTTAHDKAAGFWIRVVANFLDSIILGLVLLILNTLFLSGIALDGHTPSSELIPLYLLNFTINALYFSLTTSSKLQGTLGKAIVGIKVATIDGKKISLGRSFVRHLGYIPSGILYIGYLMVAFTKEKRGLHDFIAQTKVVYKN